MKAVTVLYHADADGFASALAIWLKLKDDANYIEVQYSQPVPKIPEGTRTLYIVDFSYKREICEALNEKYDVTIFDHHKTAERDLAGLSYANFDQYRSGCVMVWGAFHGGPLPSLFAYVQDRDLWKFELPDSEVVNLFIATLPHDFETWAKLASYDEFRTHAQTLGFAIKAFQDNQIKSALRNVRPMLLTLDGEEWEVPACNCSANVSEVGNVLCKEYPEAPFSVTYCDRKDVRSWSLRSVGDFDVSRIAKAFSGGGHARASGFSTEIGWPAFTAEEFVEGFREAAK
jgi:oligoribonuclease NrnB/cAMP/cGMP phosphodiesterase (DHH superfamily)